MTQLPDDLSWITDSLQRFLFNMKPVRNRKYYPVVEHRQERSQAWLQQEESGHTVKVIRTGRLVKPVEAEFKLTDPHTEQLMHQYWGTRMLERSGLLAKDHKLIKKQTEVEIAAWNIQKAPHVGPLGNPFGLNLTVSDYVLINSRFRSSLKDICAMRGLDCLSDYYVIRASVESFLFWPEFDKETMSHLSSLMLWLMPSWGKYFKTGVLQGQLCIARIAQPFSLKINLDKTKVLMNASRSTEYLNGIVHELNKSRNSNM